MGTAVAAAKLKTEGTHMRNTSLHHNVRKTRLTVHWCALFSQYSHSQGRVQCVGPYFHTELLRELDKSPGVPIHEHPLAAGKEAQTDVT